MSVSLIVMGAAGRMGSAIARLAVESEDLTLAALVERPEHQEKVTRPAGAEVIVASRLEDALFGVPGAVIIDFTAPAVTMETVRTASRHGSPVVIGTTGFSADQRKQLDDLARRTPLFLSPNMSVGVNVLLEELPRLAAMLGDAYDMEVTEIHHNRKKDAPSGTAARLAEALAGARGWDPSGSERRCRDGIIGERPHQEIGIQAVRGGDVVGVHTVYFLGHGERIEVTHHAHSRENFAVGALRAARWMAGRKPGRLYAMSDVLQTSGQ